MRAAPWAIAFLALVLRTLFLDARALEYDELAGPLWSGGSVLDLIRTVAEKDAHPPLYYLLVWMGEALFAWVPIEWRLRLPCAVLGAATVYLTARLGARFLGPRGGMVAAALIAVSPAHVYFSRTARMYALGAFVLVLAALAAERYRDRPTTGRAIGFGIILLLAVYTHTFAFLALPFLLARAGAFDRGRDREEGAAAESCAAAPIRVVWPMLLYGYLPWLGLARSSPLSGSFGDRLTNWLSPDLPAAFSGSFAAFVGFDPGGPGTRWLTGYLVLASALWVLATHGRRVERRAVALLAVGPILGGIALSEVFSLFNGTAVWQVNHAVLFSPFLAIGVAGFLVLPASGGLCGVLTALILLHASLSSAWALDFDRVGNPFRWIASGLEARAAERARLADAPTLRSVSEEGAGDPPPGFLIAGRKLPVMVAVSPLAALHARGSLRIRAGDFPPPTSGEARLSLLDPREAEPSPTDPAVPDTAGRAVLRGAPRLVLEIASTSERGREAARREGASRDPGGWLAPPRGRVWAAGEDGAASRLDEVGAGTGALARFRVEPSPWLAPFFGATFARAWDLVGSFWIFLLIATLCPLVARSNGASPCDPHDAE